jgi:hypothetical protein
MLTVDSGARFTWSGNRLMIRHQAPGGSPCLAVVQGAKGHFEPGGTPVSLDLPVHCLGCGTRARIEDGRWVPITGEATT